MRQKPAEAGEANAVASTETSGDFESFLQYLIRARGFDFTGYKRSSLMRRIRKRMQMVNIAEYAAYQEYLEVSPDEFSHLFNMILINVTAFFRDPAAWEYLSREVLPRLLSVKDRHDPIRVWSAGCASGEEAYTLILLLAEALGLEEYRDRVKVYATDIAEEALTQARLATYSPREVGGVPPALLEKYFDFSSGRYAFSNELRRTVIFGRQDLIRDAPMSHIDIVTCRNALIYLNVEAQAKALARLHFALNEEGVLMLGKAEIFSNHASLFTPLDLRHRIFIKAPQSSLHDRLLLTT